MAKTKADRLREAFPNMTDDEITLAEEDPDGAALAYAGRMGAAVDDVRAQFPDRQE